MPAAVQEYQDMLDERDRQLEHKEVALISKTS